MSTSLPVPPPALVHGSSLFIDFDGTLVDIAETPDSVVVHAPLLELLARIGTAMPGRVAIVSGRSLGQLDSFLGPVAGSIAVAGSHGVERRWRDGRTTPPTRVEAPEPVLAALAGFAERYPGTVIERKSYGIALHYRLSPLAEAEALTTVNALARAHGLDVQPGKMMVEMKLVGGDKGGAVHAFMDHGEMEGTRPVFIGDDLTDEAGFLAAREYGGAGVLVGAARDTAALFRLPGVPATLQWLEQALEALE